MNRRTTLVEQLLDPTATERFGAALVQRLKQQYNGRALVFLRGDLGAGKTTMVRGVLRALGHSGTVKSPTYTLLEPYAVNGQDVYHFDLYRVHDAEELAFVGFDEIIDGPGLKFVEWAQRAEDWLPEPQAEIVIHTLKQQLDQPGEAQQIGREVTAHFY